MSVPSRGEVFSKLLHHLGEAESAAATMSHLHNTEDSAKDKRLARAWLAVSELFRRAKIQAIELAKGGFN